MIKHHSEKAEVKAEKKSLGNSKPVLAAMANLNSRKPRDSNNKRRTKKPPTFAKLNQHVQGE